jgi:hypothetical protein
MRKRQEKLKQLLVTALDKTLPQLKAQVQRKNLSGPTGSTSVRKQSGKLRKNISFTKAVPKKTLFGKDSAQAQFKFETKYAKVHIGKKGKKTTIRPKRSRFLAIPTRFARRSSGVPLGGPRDPRWGNTKVINKIIFGQTGKTARTFKPLFVLREKVVVPVRVDVKTQIVKVGEAIYKREIKARLGRALA